MEINNTPRLPAELERIVALVRADRNHGANDLASICLQELTYTIDKNPDVNKHHYLQMLAELKTSRTSMVSIGNLMDRLYNRLIDQPQHSFATEAKRELDDLSLNFGRVTEAVAEQAGDIIPEVGTVMTISRSSAVTAALSLAKSRGKRIQVIQLASAPGNEGYTSALAYDRLEIPTQIITDNQVGLFIDQADMVLVGCDSWLADDYFVNKAGTYLLALAAKSHQKLFWVLADQYKDSAENHHSINLETMDPAELNAPSGPFIISHNVYFEPVPCALVTGRVDEGGCHRFSE